MSPVHQRGDAAVLYLLLQYVIAIGGMTAVGFIVWRLLQRQEGHHESTTGTDDEPRE